MTVERTTTKVGALTATYEFGKQTVLSKIIPSQIIDVPSKISHFLKGVCLFRIKLCVSLVFVFSQHTNRDLTEIHKYFKTESY